MTEGQERPAAVATAIAAVLTVPAAYAALRAYDVLFRPREPNPANVVWTPHIAMFWRLNTGVFLAGMVAIAVYPAAKANLKTTTRVLNFCVVAVAVMIGIQGIFMP